MQLCDWLGWLLCENPVKAIRQMDSLPFQMGNNFSFFSSHVVHRSPGEAVSCDCRVHLSKLRWLTICAHVLCTYIVSGVRDKILWIVCVECVPLTMLWYDGAVTMSSHKNDGLRANGNARRTKKMHPKHIFISAFKRNPHIVYDIACSRVTRAETAHLKTIILRFPVHLNATNMPIEWHRVGVIVKSVSCD